MNHRDVLTNVFMGIFLGTLLCLRYGMNSRDSAFIIAIIVAGAFAGGN